MWRHDLSREMAPPAERRADEKSPPIIIDIGTDMPSCQMACGRILVLMPRKQEVMIETETVARHSGAVNFTRPNWELVRRVAAHRGMATGGRISVSEVMNGLIDAARRELERELRGR